MLRNRGQTFSGPRQESAGSTCPAAGSYRGHGPPPSNDARIVRKQVRASPITLRTHIVCYRVPESTGAHRLTTSTDLVQPITRIRVSEADDCRVIVKQLGEQRRTMEVLRDDEVAALKHSGTTSHSTPTASPYASPPSAHSPSPRRMTMDLHCTLPLISISDRSHVSMPLSASPGLNSPLLVRWFTRTGLASQPSTLNRLFLTTTRTYSALSDCSVVFSSTINTLL